MTKNQTPKVNSSLIEKSKYEIVFESLRNLNACLGLALAGAAINYFPEASFLGEKTSTPVALFIVIASCLLMAWNAYVLIDRLSGGYSPKGKKFWFLAYIPYAILIAICMSMLNSITLEMKQKMEEAKRNSVHPQLSCTSSSLK